MTSVPPFKPTPTSTSSLRVIAVAAFLASAAGVAQAQSFDAVRLQGEPGAESEGRIGLAAIAGHEYLGSDERRYRLLPTIDYRWKNGWFAGVGNGIGFNFSSEPGFQYGLRITGDFGRKERRSAVLRGLGDIDTRAEGGAFFNWQASRELSFSSSLRYGAGNDRKGLLLDVGAHYGLMVAPQWRLGGSLSATYANSNYMQSYFGITGEQSVRSGYAVSQLGGGIRDVRLGVGLTYLINRDWSATLATSATSLQGDARDSVIVREHTPVTGILAIGYRF